MIPAGTLRQRITIQQSTDSQDATGQPIRTWANVISGVPARVESVAGGETVRGRQVMAQTTTLLTTRWMSGITPSMRIVFCNRTLGILRVNDPVGDRRELRIECKEADQ